MPIKTWRLKMANYLVNKNPDDGYHEVHTTSCSHKPSPSNQMMLGAFASCHGAVAKAKKIYPKSDGCYWCSRPCHTR